MAIGKDKFSGGVRYYHRHTDSGERVGPSMMDWEDRQKLVRKKQRRRILLGLLALVLVLGVVAGTYVLMLP